MSASAALAILALCEQGKFRIRGKADWTEPLNLFVVVVAEPSERKSAVISLMTRPVNAFEADYNRQNAAELETSKRKKANIYLWYDGRFTVTCIKEVPFSEIGNVVDKLYNYTCKLCRTGAATEENLSKLRYTRPQV